MKYGIRPQNDYANRLRDTFVNGSTLAHFSAVAVGAVPVRYLDYDPAKRLHKSCTKLKQVQ